MPHRILRVSCAFVLCAAVGACQTTGHGQLNESRAQKEQDAVDTRVALGKAYMQQGRFELAQENLLKALERSPNSVDAHTVIAVLYEQLGNPKAAETHYARAAELAPKSGDTNNNYGQFLCATGRYDEAQKYYARAMEDPFYKTPGILYSNAGMCLADHGGEAQLGQAEKYLRQALEVDPNNAMALYYIARVLYTKNDFFHARAFIQRFETLGKPDPAALLLARNIEVKLGHADSAKDYAQRLHKDFPESEQTRSLDGAVPSAQ
jgi:type IV pilus assembly protein PilF